MRRWLALVVAAAAASCVAHIPGWVQYPEVEAAHAPSPHSYKGAPVCQACHVDDRTALLAGPVATCTRCHQARHTPGHESGTQLDPKRVGGLPLPGGRVVCHTCHAEHDVHRYRHGLRRPVNELCRACHAGY